MDRNENLVLSIFLCLRKRSEQIYDTILMWVKVSNVQLIVNIIWGTLLIYQHYY